MLYLEGTLKDKYQKNISPFWQQQIVFGKFGGQLGVEIVYAYALHPKPIDTLVISSGRIESILKYQEVMFDFYQLGYSVFILDHRGQGLSGRMLANSQMGYVEHFQDYVNDLKVFTQQVVMPFSKQTPVFLCHSMGGAIGSLFAIKYPELVKKMALCAPMFGIRPVLPRWFSKLLLKMFFIIYKNPDYFWGQKDYLECSFEVNKLTHCHQRYRQFRQTYMDSTKTLLGGVTGHWLQAAINAMEEIEKQASSLKVPVLILQAGADHIVDNKSQKQIALTIPNSQFINFPKAKHELLMESDEYRVPSLEAIHHFFVDNSK